MILATGGEAIQFCVTAGEAQPNLRTSHPIQLRRPLLLLKFTLACSII